MKYIMLRTKFAGVDKLIPIIFPDFMIHADIDKAVKEILLNIHKQESETFSAGDIDILGCQCSCESTTLEVCSQEIDTNVIDTYDYLHGLIDTDDKEVEP